MHRVLSLALGLALLWMGLPGSPGPLDAGAEEAGPALTCLAPAPCPDLVVDARSLSDARTYTQGFEAGDCAVEEGLVEEGQRRLLRFSTSLANRGTGDLVLGAPWDRPDIFTWSPCHGHHHLDGVAAYRLWTLEGYALWQHARALAPQAPAGELLEGHPDVAEHLVSTTKQGFCMEDHRPVAPLVGQATYHCAYQGLSVGWIDTYGWHLDGQWVDVTGVEGGSYVLEVEVNPHRVLEEATYEDNAVGTLVDVPP